jgi:rhamnosyltransferase
LVTEHVYHLLEHVRQDFSRIVFASCGPVVEASRERLEALVDEYMETPGEGDFAAWGAAIRAGVNCPGGTLWLATTDMFGPLCDLGAVLDKLEGSGTDFWGLSAYTKRYLGNDEWEPVPRAPQHSLLGFSDAVAASDAFQSLFDESAGDDDLEVLLSQALSDFKLGVFLEDSPEGLDQSLYEPGATIAAGIPFVRREPFLDNLYPPAIRAAIAAASAYPLSLVDDHFSQTALPTESLAISEKWLVPGQLEDPSRLRVAVHLHAFYLEILEEYLERMVWPFDWDLLVTTDSEDKARRIEEIAARRLRARSLETVVTENRGRDIVPWLSVAERLADYDVVGHFHTKARKTAVAEWGKRWQDELLNTLVDTAAGIVGAFDGDERLGIAIPDIPSLFHYQPIYYDNEQVLAPLIAELWDRMGCRRTVNWQDQLSYVMAYGNMFWYRPAALARLATLPLQPDELPGEPLPQHGTIMHAIERLPVYVAWDAGFDYAIAPNPTRVPALLDNAIHNKALSKKAFAVWRKGYDDLQIVSDDLGGQLASTREALDATREALDATTAELKATWESDAMRLGSGLLRRFGFLAKLLRNRRRV